MSGSPRRLIGLVGPPGVGKSTMAARLADEDPSAAALPMDGFHLPQSRLVELGRRERMGAPDTFDVAAFSAVLAALRADDAPVTAPGFDRTVEEPVAGTIAIGRGIRTIYVEGNYLLHDADGWQAIAPLLDETWYLELDDELRRERLIARHVRSGKTPDAAAAWVRDVDEPNARLISRGAERATRRLAVD
ncbi:MAG TPA: nucleoside/nucleotide kinase family protein [Pseudolysinimonas sp.]|jgi:pantothenate kinase